MKEYQDFLNAYKELQKLVDGYYASNDYGEQAKLSDEDIAELNKMYQDVFNMASAYLDSIKEENALAEKTNMENADHIQELLQKDMNALQEMLPGMTLPSCLKYVNNKVVNVSGKEFDYAGANSNSRQRMTITGPDGKPINGFFTERHYEGLNPANAPYFVKKLSRRMPKCSELFEYALPKIFEQYSTEGGYLYFESTKDLDERFGQLEGYKDALNAMQRLFERLTKHSNLVQMYLSEKNPVSPFETRNVAMSNVAHLLGVDNIIAKSTILTIKRDGEELQGSFMEFAKGEDPDGVPGDEGMINMNKYSFDHSPALKTLSDMMVLDYICGNTDRHAKNIFYQCDKDGKVLDVMGIDNDMSFGHQGRNVGSMNSMGLDGIFQMSKSMYEKLMNLDKHQLRHALDGLSLEKKVQDLTLERLDAIKEKINDGKIIIIDDKDFVNYKLSDFTIDEFREKKAFVYKDQKIDKIPFLTAYKHVRGVHYSMEAKREYRAENPNWYRYKKKPGDSDAAIDFEGDKIIKVEDLEIGMDAPAIQDLTDKLERAGALKANNTPEFNLVKMNLETFKAASDNIGKDEKLLTVRTVAALAQGYKNLLKDCNNYFRQQAEKTGLNKKSRTQIEKANAAIREVSKFCKGRISTLQASIDRTMGKEYVDKTEIREMKNEAQTLMNEGMSKEEVGQYVKSLVNMQKNNPDNKQMLAKLGQQITMCMDYMKEKSPDGDVNLSEYGLQKEDMLNARNLLREGRIANAELKKEQLSEIKDASSKASVMM